MPNIPGSEHLAVIKVVGVGGGGLIGYGVPRGHWTIDPND
mgnify:CR=1 FL=1